MLLIVLALTSVVLCSACEPVDPLLGAPPAGTTHSVIEARYGQWREYRDVLFVIDGSPSMADKKRLIRLSLASMIRHYAIPDCIGEDGERFERALRCPVGSTHESEPLRSMNIGVISASLGGHGSSACLDGVVGKHGNDRAHLIPTVRPGTPNPNGRGFLTWRGGDEEDLEQLISNLEAQIDAVGIDGCEYPAPLEAWYRFLVDPAPPAKIAVDEWGRSGPVRDFEGQVIVDTELLAQREAFLRPESSVSIVMISDKNDCSVMEGGTVYEGAGLGHRLLSTETPLPKAPSICETNPNDRCCFSCLDVGVAPAGCDVSECLAGEAVPPGDDHPALRCFDGRRRFGMDFLYPIQRYIDGLSRQKVIDAHTGLMVNNALLTGVGKHQGNNRFPGAVLLTGVVGVPWQDIATSYSSIDSGEMSYASANELLLRDPVTLADRWQYMLGEPGLPARSKLCQEEDESQCGALPTAPLDPFMIESILPRSNDLSNPSGDFIEEPLGNNPRENAINGHELSNVARDRLQFTCTFPLAEVITGCDASESACECSEVNEDSPLCQPPGGGTAGSTQYWGGAYPGTRILEVLKGVGDNGIVDSICPKITEGDESLVGYQATYQMSHDWPMEGGDFVCLEQELDANEEGQVNCIVVEAVAPNPDFPDTWAGSYDCVENGRLELSEFHKDFVKGEMSQREWCGSDGGRSCEEFHFCSLPQLLGEAQVACVVDPLASEWHATPGFCYIDAAAVEKSGEAQGERNNNYVLNSCGLYDRRLLRVVGSETPRKGALTLFICQETELGEVSVASLIEQNPPIPSPARDHYSELE